jgi:hypothetical protein
MNSTNGSMISIVRKLIKSGNAEQMKAIFTLPLSRPYLNELVVYAIYTGDTGVIDEFVKQKVSLETPPPSITKGANDDKDVVELIESYKEAPYVIFATIIGKIKTVECLLSHQRKLSEVGHIGYSPKKHNSILSNCLGAAAFYGHKHIVDWISASYSIDFSDMMNYKSTEKLSSSKISKLNNECNGYTPLQLCIVGADNISLFIELLTCPQSQCDCKDSKGNNLIHLCVIYNKVKYLQYLIEKYASKKMININDRNSDVSMLYRESLLLPWHATKRTLS